MWSTFEHMETQSAHVSKTQVTYCIMFPQAIKFYGPILVTSHRGSAYFWHQHWYRCKMWVFGWVDITFMIPTHFYMKHRPMTTFSDFVWRVCQNFDFDVFGFISILFWFISKVIKNKTFWRRVARTWFKF